MGKRQTSISQIPDTRVRSSAGVLDEGRSEWNEGYDQTYKRLQPVLFLDAKVFDNVAGTWTSKEFKCAPYSKFSLLVNLVWENTVTDVQIFIEESDDAVNWYQKVDGPFGAIIYVPAQGDLKETIDGDMRNIWCRLRAVCTGSDAVNKATLTAKMVLIT